MKIVLIFVMKTLMLCEILQKIVIFGFRAQVKCKELEIERKPRDFQKRQSINGNEKKTKKLSEQTYSTEVVFFLLLLFLFYLQPQHLILCVLN